MNKIFISAFFSCLLVSCSASSNDLHLKNASFDEVESIRQQAEKIKSKEEKEKIYIKLIQEYTSLSEQGNANAQYILGDIYSKGLAGKVDQEKSFFWTKKAADSNHIEAIYNTGMKYYIGQGVEKDLEAAKKYFKKSADQGDVDSLYSIGKIYIDENNLNDGIKYLKKAAEKNDALALFELGLLSCEGVKVKLNYRSCNNYWEKSASLNNAEANLNLGINLVSGKGDVNIEKGVVYLKKASDLGKSQASYNLGYIYESKEYGYYNEDLSQFFYKKAYDQGMKDALFKIKQ